MARHTKKTCGKPVVSREIVSLTLAEHYYPARPVLTYPQPGYTTPDLTGKYRTITRSELGVAGPIYGPRDVRPPPGYTGRYGRSE